MNISSFSGENITIASDSVIDELVACEESLVQEIPEYHLGQRVDPPSFPSYQDDENDELLEECFRRNVARSLANGLPTTEDAQSLPLLGSWTAFNREVPCQRQQKSLIEYMPVINQPPDFAVCKNSAAFKTSQRILD